MLHLPSTYVTEAARHNLARFCATSAAKELDEDSRVWSVVEWSWQEGPPLRVFLRSDRGDVLDFVMDEGGVWRIGRDPNVPREPVG
jgi:hypothetical protein